MVHTCCYAAENYRHLVEIMKKKAYLFDKVKRLEKAWRESDACCIQEYQALLDEVPLRARKKPRTEDFDIGETSLNLVACSTTDLPPPGMTP